MNPLPFHSRFQDADWYPLDVSVLVIGCGGIGSWTALAISRILSQRDFLVIFDDDIVESSNIGGQFFGNENVGEPKVNALYSQCRRLGSVAYIDPYSENYGGEESITNSITIVGTDNMESRKEAYNLWKTEYGNNKNAIFIDGRLTINMLQVIAIRGQDTERQKEYEETFLFENEDAADELCNLKQTTYLAMMIGGQIANTLVNHIAFTRTGKKQYKVPFFYQYLSEPMKVSVR
jgi:molybdopterin/thiamine biosynthesis adenylyltransferase